MNRELFVSSPPSPLADAVNAHGAAAYQRTAENALAQYALTGCFGQTFYASGKAQLDELLKPAAACSPQYVADVAIYARRRGFMKDTPTVLVAHLATRDPVEFCRAFALVIDDARRVRAFVQAIRSGVVGRRSLGSAPKRMIAQWFAKQSAEALYRGNVGDAPSLADVIRLAHVKATDDQKAAFRLILGFKLTAQEIASLPVVIMRMLQFIETKCAADMPERASLMHLVAHASTPEHWRGIARRASWTETRINLAAFTRHGAFDGPDGEIVLSLLAARLRNPDNVRAARAMPYEILRTLNATETLHPMLLDALQDALGTSLERVPCLAGATVVALDISSSMTSLVTGAGTTTCLEVAAIFAAAIVSANPQATVIAFNRGAHVARLNPRDSLWTNAGRCVEGAGGGTDCAAPIELILRDGIRADQVIMISDEESWAQDSAKRPRLTTAWERLKRDPRYKKTKMIALDIAPTTTTQLAQRSDTFRVAGFTDAVFQAIEAFTSGRSWDDLIRESRTLSSAIGIKFDVDGADEIA